MVTFKNAWVTLLAVAVLLFILSNIIDIYSGTKPVYALLENIFGSLQINYSVIHLYANVNDNLYTLTSNLIDSIVFALVTVMLATWFVNLISGISLKGRLLLSRISRTKDHVIIAPFNPLAQALLNDLKEARIKSVVVTENTEDLKGLREQNTMALVGVVKSAEVFETAGIKRAKYVIACSDDDLQNALITITAKNANPNIKIISRVTDEADIPKLSIAGAYWTIKPEITAGEKIADELLKIVV